MTKANYLYRGLVVAAACLFAWSCKKVITVDLQNAPAQIVIEGNVTDLPGPYQVKISKTVNFYASNSFPPVTGATVSIRDITLGQTEVLKETDSGVYSTRHLTGAWHHTYVLQVSVDGQQYTATSTMPARVPLDSVTLVDNIGVNSQEQINAEVNFQDPGGIENYYQFTEEVNGRQVPDIFVFEDRLSDGKYIEIPLFNDSSYLQRGDSLTLTMNCVDENIYNYFFTLMNVSGNNNTQGVTPANPTTNLSNGALGYFSAHTSEIARLRIY